VRGELCLCACSVFLRKLLRKLLCIFGVCIFSVRVFKFVCVAVCVV